MKWNILLATLVLGFMTSQSYAAGLLDQMLGSGCGASTSCCQTPSCCTPKPRCCMPKPRCYAPPAATCCAPEPSCHAPVDCGCPSAPSCKPKFATPLRDALHNLFQSCKRSHCGCGVEATCAAPEVTCAAPSACGCDPCAKRHHGGLLGHFGRKSNCGCAVEPTCVAPEAACGCPSDVACGCDAAPSCCQPKVCSCTPIRDAISRLFCCHTRCNSGCGCDTGCDSCGSACGYDMGSPSPAAPEAEMDDMPPAPVPADAMTFVPARRRVVSSR